MTSEENKPETSANEPRFWLSLTFINVIFHRKHSLKKVNGKK